MPNTFVKIASVTVGAGGALSITFDNIPQNFTDLTLKLSLRDTGSGSNINVAFNTTTLSGTQYSTSRLYGQPNVPNVVSDAFTGQPAAYAGWLTFDASGIYTANTFASMELYIPNYTSSNQKSLQMDGVSENNSTTATLGLHSGLWSGTAAITTVYLQTGGTLFKQYSTATLYGIKNS